MPEHPVLTPDQLRRLIREQQRQYLEDIGMTGPEGELPPEAASAADHRNPRRRRQREEDDEAEVGTLVETEVRDELDLLVLHEDAKKDILAGLRAIEMRADLDRIWNISQVQPQAGRCILNFFGPPGTGKTRVARAIARRLGKKLYQVDYSAIISKYLGDTAKHIAQAFRRATAHNAVLFFDEADSLLSKRVDMNESCATSINQNRNVLMQCLDAFNGVVIMTTNLFGNYDEALLRRIAKHVKFELPNRMMRRRLFELHLPNRTRIDADLLEVAKASKGLSGGDILNVCLNSIYAGSVDENPENWKITAAILKAEIDKVLEAKKQHKERKPRSERPIGFGAVLNEDRELEQ
jgi:SpoVK/Ycf46/Vps4 family AAA+-type ATPase